MPYADLGGFDQDRMLSAVSDLFTVDLVTRYVAWKLGPGVAVGPNDPGAAHPQPSERR
jgi:hypothetical protein